jgi:transposase
MKKKMSEEELNNIPKDMIIKMYVQLSDSFDLMNSQMDQLIKQDKELNRNLALMKEQIAILTQNRFGRKTEKSADIPSGQMTIMDILPEDMRDVFNEAEATAEDNVAEPDMETITYKRKKTP